MSATQTSPRRGTKFIGELALLAFPRKKKVKRNFFLIIVSGVAVTSEEEGERGGGETVLATVSVERCENLLFFFPPLFLFYTFAPPLLTKEPEGKVTLTGKAAWRQRKKRERRER